MFARLKCWLLRWQEQTILLPLLLFLGFAAWVVLGAIDRTASGDILVQWIELPIRCAYAAAALALTGLVRRRWRYKLDAEAQKQWWYGVMNGMPGPLVVLVVDAVVTLACVIALLHFFSLPA